MDKPNFGNIKYFSISQENHNLAFGIGRKKDWLIDTAILYFFSTLLWHTFFYGVITYYAFPWCTQSGKHCHQSAAYMAALGRNGP